MCFVWVGCARVPSQIRPSRVTCSVSFSLQAQPQPQDADAVPRRDFRKRCEKTAQQLDSCSALGPKHTVEWGSGAQNQDSTQGGQGREQSGCQGLVRTSRRSGWNVRLLHQRVKSNEKGMPSHLTFISVAVTNQTI